MSFLKRLFGLGGGDGQSPDETAPPEDYKDFLIRATPFEEGGAFQICGVIAKEVDGEEKKHVFIRADRLPSREVAENMTLAKARQIVDLEGERIFQQR